MTLANLRTLRYGVIFGTALFLFFGLFDYLLLSDVFFKIFSLRFWLLLLAIPVAVLTLLKSGGKLLEIFVYVLYVYAVLIYAYIQYQSSYYGEVFYLYQFGYILLLLWIGFVFRTRLWHIVSISLLIVTLNNFICITSKNVEVSTAWLLGINLLLVACFSMVVLGVFFLKRFESSIERKNEKLNREKVQLQKAKEKAEQADHLKTAFLANLSHEIRTPLNAVAGFSAIIAEEDIGQEERLLYSKCIVDNSEDLVELIEDIINFSMVESNGLESKKELIVINDLFESINFYIKRLLIRHSDKQDMLIEKPWHENVSIYVDAKQIAEVFKVLISNALKFTEVGHIVYGIKDVNENEMICFVKDTGMGIPEDKFELIFDKFTQANKEIQSKFGGAGIGLALCAKMVNAMGGRIWVESELNKGSLFQFTVKINEAVN